MSGIPKRVRKGRIGRTLKLVLTAGLLAFGATAYYQMRGSTEDWRGLLRDSPGFLLIGVTVLLSLSGLATLWLGPLRRPRRLDDGRLVFARSALGRTWSAISGVLITGFIAAFIIHSGHDWFALGLLALAFFGAALQLARPRGPLTLGAAGIAGADRRRPMIAWNEIDSINLTEYNESRTIEIKLVGGAEQPPASRLSRIFKWVRNPNRVLIIPATLRADPYVMLDALEDFRNRHGKSSAVGPGMAIGA